MMAFVSEANLELLALEQLRDLGYALSTDAKLNPDGIGAEREAYSDVILVGRLRDAIDRLNPTIPVEARADALRKVLATDKPSVIEENRRLHKLIIEGVDVEFQGVDGSIRGDKVWLVDFEQVANNDWLVASQFIVIDRGLNRRPDIVVFLNGMPFAVIELKAPGGEGTPLAGAFNQLQNYKAQIPSLFRTNAFLIISDGIFARLGSLTADRERFMPWRTAEDGAAAAKGTPELEILLQGVLKKEHVLSLLRDFIAFGETGSGITKIIAGYHQVHAVRRAVASTVEAASAKGDGKIGVIWHTQGSGKSLLMAFYAGQLVRRPELENPTIVVITDRNDLDDQLFSTFAMYRDLIRQTPVHANRREDLQAMLGRVAGGVIFATIQKFSPPAGESAYQVLSNRRNIIVIADEAHRSQYGFHAKIKRDTGAIAYGFAKYLRDALPNASFIGFTGTPIEKDDINTPAVFGRYIDVYDISQAVKDGATVPIYYESRLARVELSDDEKPRIDAEIEELTEDEAATEQERIKKKWTTVEALVGSKRRLATVAADLVQHFEARASAIAGKAMIVCMSRRICVALYEQIVLLRPEWHGKDNDTGVIKIVMTGSAADPEDWQPHIGTKARRDLLARRAKDPHDPLQLIIVCDMWLTGFDAPALHTMYIDKPMRGHGLMQAIARVNRIFRDKPAGLVADYIGVAQNLKDALGQYSASDQREVGIDESRAVALFLEKFEIVHAMYHGFNYKRALSGTPHQRLAMLGEAIEWILSTQHEAMAKASSADDKRQEGRRYQDAVLVLSKAYSLASASDRARELRDEVAFFQAVRALLANSSSAAGIVGGEHEFAIRQILDRSILSTDIVDILAAAGIRTPDISILSDEFLAEIRSLKTKNLALEALRRLLSDEIQSRRETNVVEAKHFSERLEAAIARYHTSAISTVEVLQDLINLAKDIRAARHRGENEGLTQDEVAFYDALAESESAVDVLGNRILKVIAHELLLSLKKNVTVDWTHRESARARMRVLVKRILRTHGYPPDLQDEAVQTVLRQAEALSSAWAAQE